VEKVMKRVPDKENRGKILSRSRVMFMTQGISAVTMERIAARQGISKKTLYRFFPNKNELIAAVVEDQISEMREEILEISRTGESLLDRMRAILRVVSERLAGLGENLIRDIYYKEPEIWERVDRFRRETVLGIITKLLDEGRRSGFIRKDVDTRLLPTIFLNALGSILSPSQFLAMPVPPAKVFDQLIHILFGGILTAEARKMFFSGGEKE
jgi:AcrR family transcriptional regulator